MDRLAFWRGLAAFASVAAIGLAVLLAEPRAGAAADRRRARADRHRGRRDAAPASFVASISGDGRAGDAAARAGQRCSPTAALELWAVPPHGAPRSLGLISASGATVVLRGKRARRRRHARGHLEPPGGSPTGEPTGPVLYAGKLTL